MRGAYGVKGWVRIAPFVADGVVLDNVRRWWLIGDTQPQALSVQEVKRRTESILAKWVGCDTKEAADALKGRTIAVARSDFPVPGDGEHYVGDIVGYRVVNRQGIELGRISGLRAAATGADAAMQCLEVAGGQADQLLLIPLVDQYVESIERETQLIRVDWQRDW